MNVAELIKALRYCRTSNCCQFCPSDRKDIVWTVDECIDKLHNDAADALEAAEKRIAELSLDCELFQQKCMELEAQIPKEGEWIWLSSTYDRVPCEKRYWCSVCHHEEVAHYDKPWKHYCPNCGAKMKGEEK